MGQTAQALPQSHPRTFPLHGFHGLPSNTRSKMPDGKESGDCLLLPPRSGVEGAEDRTLIGWCICVGGVRLGPRLGVRFVCVE